MLIRADVRFLPLKDSVVQCCVTSPPYWGQRDYNDGLQLGQEPTLNEYISNLTAAFREVRRVLRDDGVLWLNLGDSYAANLGGTPMPAETIDGGVSGEGRDASYRGRKRGWTPHRDKTAHGLKHKDLIGLPWRVAFSLQSDGWYLRSDIIWEKPNVRPESVADRPTKSHEYIFMLSKREKYYYNAKAVEEPSKTTPAGRRNRRTVWNISTNHYRVAHFAVFPKDIPRICILAGSKKGDIVLDPFGGSGTTAEVAAELGRKSIHVDLTGHELAKTRIATQVLPLPLSEKEKT